MEPNMETILISLCIAISGGVIGYIFGYRHGSGDMDRTYKDVYDISPNAWGRSRIVRRKLRRQALRRLALGVRQRLDGCNSEG